LCRGESVRAHMGVDKNRRNQSIEFWKNFMGGETSLFRAEEAGHQGTDKANLETEQHHQVVPIQKKSDPAPREGGVGGGGGGGVGGGWGGEGGGGGGGGGGGLTPLRTEPGQKGTPPGERRAKKPMEAHK